MRLTPRQQQTKKMIKQGSCTLYTTKTTVIFLLMVRVQGSKHV